MRQNRARSGISHHDIAARVRGNVLPALIASLLLVYFGFFYFAMPQVTDLFSLGDVIFQYTLRVGGMLMAGVAAGSLIGVRVALLADAFVSMGIGVLLILSAGMMIAGGGGLPLHQILYLLFGGMFVSAGVRNGREYFLLTPPELHEEAGVSAGSASDDRFGRSAPPGP